MMYIIVAEPVLIITRYFLLGHPVQCISNNVPRGTRLILFLIPLNYVFLFVFFFVSLLVRAVSSYWSRHEIRNTVTYETEYH